MLKVIGTAKPDLEHELLRRLRDVNSNEPRISELMSTLDQVSDETKSTRRDVMHKVWGRP